MLDLDVYRRHNYCYEWKRRSQGLPTRFRAEQVAARWHYLSATVTSASGSTVVHSLSQNDVLPVRDKSLHYLNPYLASVPVPRRC